MDPGSCICTQLPCCLGLPICVGPGGAGEAQSTVATRKRSEVHSEPVLLSCPSLHIITSLRSLVSYGVGLLCPCGKGGET